MSLKRIPTPTQDAGNWGTILNDHLAQTQNPLNGAFNSFDQFSARPTNLTADDTGKTYLYTQTGNWHEWSGSEWKVQNKSEINVKDYGAIGDGVADDTAALQLCVNLSRDTYGMIFIPYGTYLCNLRLPDGGDGETTPSIRGQGVGHTFLQSFTADGYAVTITNNDNWQKFEISHLTFTGNRYTLKQGGIVAGGVVDTPLDELCGGVSLHHVNFNYLDVGINLTSGNIGNSFEHCSFKACNYHFKNVAVLGVPGVHARMNAAANTFYKCHFQGAKVTCIYIDGIIPFENGALIWRDCIFEINPGFCFFVKNVGGFGQNPSLKLENNWWEGNANSPKVNIDGVDYVPKYCYFENTNVKMSDTTIVDMYLVRSVINISNATCTGLNKNEIIKDAESAIIMDRFSSFGTNIQEKFYVSSASSAPIYKAGVLNDFTSIFNTTPRRCIVNSGSYNVLFSESFTQPVIFNGGSSSSKIVKEGRTFPYSNQVTIQPNATVSLGSFVIPTNKYIVWSLDNHKINGEYGMDIKNITTGSQIGYQIQNKTTDKLSFVGLISTFEIPAFEASLVISNNIYSSAVQLSAFQVVAFDSHEEAIKFIDSGVFCMKSGTPINIQGEGIPTSGMFNKGDIIYNTNPAPSGFVGWICTTAGAPGAWKGFGLIEN